ncbi:MAG: HigA family addiction module antitoxin [Thermomicrobiales bacterium]
MSKLPIHPGIQITMDLEDVGLSANQLAKALHIPQNRLSEIIRGRRGISADTALRLSVWQGTSPQYWMNLQRNYELDTVEAERGEEIRMVVEPYATT